MRMLTKAMIAIAMTGAAAVAVPGTGNAQSMYYGYGHPGFEFGWGGPWAWGGPMYRDRYGWGGGSYAYVRRDGRYRPYGPRARAYGQMHRWDPYRLRWDGSGQ